MASIRICLVLLFLLVNVTGLYAGYGHRKEKKQHRQWRHGAPHDSHHQEPGHWDDSQNKWDDSWYEWNDDWGKGSEERGRGSSDEDWDWSHENDGSGHHKGHHKHHGHHHWKWDSAKGVGVLVVIVAASLGVVSLLVWLTCRKCRKEKVGQAGPLDGLSRPLWALQLIYQPELGAGFGLVSEGFTRIGPSHVVRTRKETNVTDGAIWAVAMTKGKHVFEITWPWVHRGAHATIGVATAQAPIKAKGAKPLVGSNLNTWGLDIVQRETMHSNNSLVACPTDGSYVPDRFMMYVDMDEGTLGFGNDVTYWGEVMNLPTDGAQPLAVMIGSSRWQAEISVEYKGSAPDGENTSEKTNPPHHLPPLDASACSAPPHYSDINKMEEPMMVKPAEPEEKSISPPPPYSPDLEKGKTPDV